MARRPAKVLGIDEAGRGPVIGPLVVAGVLVQSERELAELEALGVRDSKALTRPQRQALAREIEKIARVELKIIPARALDARGVTTVELEAMAQILRKVRPRTALIDAPVAPGAIPSFKGALRRALPFDCELVVENKADARYPLVAAASIVAKVQRDREMARLRRRYGERLGWGYPSEPGVRAFLRRCAERGEFPDCVRRRWRTVRRLLERPLAPEAPGGYTGPEGGLDDMTKGETKRDYGVEEALLDAARRLQAHAQAQAQGQGAGAPGERLEAVDRVIRRVGPHQVAHFLATTGDAQAVAALRAYLQRHWPAYLELVERLIQAARRPENEDVMREFGGD